MNNAKDIVKGLLKKKEYQEVLSRFGENRKTVRLLRSLLYEEEAIIRWRAVTMLGRLAANNPKLVKKELDRLLWSMNDEAGYIGRGAPEAIGEIGRADLKIAGSAVKVVFEYLNDPETCRPPNRNIGIVIGVIWAIGRVGNEHREFVQEFIPTVESFLDDPDPNIRAHAAWSLGQAGSTACRQTLSQLARDKDCAILYEDEELLEKEVGVIAAEALEHIDS